MSRIKQWIAKKKKAAFDEFDLDDEYPEFKGWEAIGFHRSLGRELWQIIIEQLNNILYGILMVYLIPIIQPFPMIQGINSLAGSLYYTIFVIFDTGTNFGINRFIAEYRIKDPRRMLQYVGFYIRYQMITGVIQVTVMSWYTFGILVHGQYAYLTWMLLLVLQRQWPGMLGIFKTVLQGLQHYAKVEIFNLLQSQLVERFTLVGFVLVGRWWGANNPAIGIIVGICVFTQLGSYIDDVIFGFIAGYFTNKILKQYVNLSLRDVFRTKVSRDVLKEMLVYGVQGSLLPIMQSSIGTLTVVWYSQEIPGYLSWSALIGWGATFSNVIGNIKDFALLTAVAEAYPNGKQELVEFYVSYTLRWRYFFYILIALIMLSIIPYFVYIIENTGGLQFYSGATVFFIPMLFKRIFDPIIDLPGSIMVGVEKITQYNIIRVIEEVLKLLFAYLFVFVFRLQDAWGLVGLVIIIGYRDFVATIIKTTICLVYIQRKIVHIKVYFRSTFLSPFISALPVVGLTQAFYNVGFVPLITTVGFEIAITISILLALVALTMVYFPLNVLVGGWDDYMLHVFRKAVKLSGPSWPIFFGVYKIMEKTKILAQKIGTWDRDGWTIPHEKAHEQIIELMDLKRKTLQETK
ncbi:hypothetical protein GF325_10595 [Candidatus Bathyarchaeota archaeon]|nr:hypothetical protein [Candidatus Bathyarchaeota archaeon]